MDSTQSNTVFGDIVVKSGEDLSEAAGYLGVLSAVSGETVAKKASAVTDNAIYIIVDGGDASGDNVELRPIDAYRNHRVKLSGTCDPGDTLTVHTDGCAIKLPAGAGTYFQIGTAEEIGVAGQLVLFRAGPSGPITIAG